jgi:hypothetical protein
VVSLPVSRVAGEYISIAASIEQLPRGI